MFTFTTTMILLSFLLLTSGVLAQTKTKTKIKSADATVKMDKPTNEAIGPTVQVAENNAGAANAYDQQQQQQQGQAPIVGFAPYQGPLFGSGALPQAIPNSQPVQAAPQQVYSPVQWPGAPEPFQPAPVSPDQRDFNGGYDPRIKSPYQELLKSLASTAPIFPPEPEESVQHSTLAANTGNGQIYFGQVTNGAEGGVAYVPVSELDQKHLDKPGPPRAPLNVENANYLTAVASIPSRLGPVAAPQLPSQLLGSNTYSSGAMLLQGASGGVNPSMVAPSMPSIPMPSPGKMTSYPVGPSPQPQQPFSPYPSVGKPISGSSNVNTMAALGSSNPNQWIYTHSGNQYPIIQNGPTAGAGLSANKYPTGQQQQLLNQIQQYANFVRPQQSEQAGQQQQANFNAQRHPSNFSQFSAPRLSPFTVQVGDILGFPPGTPFSAVPAGLPTGSRLANKVAEPSQTFAARSPPPAAPADPYRRGYSEITSDNIRPNSVTKPDGYEKSEELVQENKRPFSQQSNASVVSYTRSMCQVCDEIDKILRLYNITVYTFELDTMDKGQEMYTLLLQQTGSKEMPQVFVCGRYIGGYSRVLDLHKSGELKRMFQRC